MPIWGPIRQTVDFREFDPFPLPPRLLPPPRASGTGLGARQQARPSSLMNYGRRFRCPTITHRLQRYSSRPWPTLAHSGVASVFVSSRIRAERLAMGPERSPQSEARG
uniref:Uncharacterized protein n=1 Tax=Steinernema glaseri TaxID=37863 RepID=A0A1I7ZKC5_9BILA